MLPLLGHGTVYHGTNLFAATLIQRYGIWLNVQRNHTDFGRGFYVTLNKKQAVQWAKVRAEIPPVNKKLLKLLKISEEFYKQHPFTKIPALLMFKMDYNRLQQLNGFIFPLPHHPNWPFYKDVYTHFVYKCRHGNPHNYDFVYGPVGKPHQTLWSTITFSKKKDQLSLNTLVSISMLKDMKIFIL
ncbi:hypothetical protein BTR23_14090 [Alkalihalophilus pseudofirmus]|nr:hypothetical protein BTR23_14090 [Alkalihalophilus pseudofirmus]